MLKLSMAALFWFPGRSLVRVEQDGKFVASLEVVRDESSAARDGYSFPGDYFDSEARVLHYDGPQSLWPKIKSLLFLLPFEEGASVEEKEDGCYLLVRGFDFQDIKEDA